MIEHPVCEQEGSRLRVTPFVHPQTNAIRFEVRRAFGSDGIRMAGIVHGTREHTGGGRRMHSTLHFRAPLEWSDLAKGVIVLLCLLIASSRMPS